MKSFAASWLLAAAIMLLEFKVSSGAPIAPLPDETRVTNLIENYHTVIRTKDCESIRSYAARMYNAAIMYDMRRQISSPCRAEDNPSVFDEMKRIICVLRVNLTETEKITLLFMATIYAIMFFFMAFFLLVFVAFLWASIALCFDYLTASAPSPKTLLLRASEIPSSVHGYYKSSAPGRVIKVAKSPSSPPPPPYERV